MEMINDPEGRLSKNKKRKTSLINDLSNETNPKEFYNSKSLKFDVCKKKKTFDEQTDNICSTFYIRKC